MTRREFFQRRIPRYRKDPLCVHAVQQVFQLECFLFEVNADGLCSTSCIFSREYHSHALLYLL